MFSRSLLVRSSPLRLSTALTTRVCSRSLSTLRVARPLWPANTRRFSAEQTTSFTKNWGDERTSPSPSGTCYVGNIPYNVTAEELKDAFSEFGKIVSVNLLTTDSGVSRGVGFVRFESVQEAVSFVEANEADPIFVLDRQIFVEHAQKARNVVGLAEPSDTLVIFNFQGESEAEVRAMFDNYSDDILAVRFDKKEAGLPLRKAFIQFRNVNMATEAMDVLKSQNENARVRYASQRQPPTGSYSFTSRRSQHQS